MRPRRGDAIIGRLLTVLLLSLLVTALLLRYGDLAGDAPSWAVLLVLLLGLGAAAAVYEGLGWALGRLVALMRRASVRDSVPDDSAKENAPAPGFRVSGALLALLAYLAAMVIVWMVAAFGAGLLAGDLDRAVHIVASPYSPVILLVSVLAGALGAALVYLRMASPRDREATAAWLKPSPPAVAAGLAILGVLGAWLFVVTVPRLVEFTGDTPSTLAQMQAHSNLAGHAILLFTVIAVAPVVEELLFRGVLLDGFARRWGHLFSVLVVTFLFVLVHLPEAVQYWPSAAMIGALGAAAAWVRLKYGSIGAAIALHAGYNIGVVSLWQL